MITNILTTVATYAHLNVHTPEDLVRAHLAVLQSKTRQGIHAVPHASKHPLVGYVNHGRWVGDCCDCGSGVSLHPEWTEGRCFACGAVYAAQFPPNVAQIEALLVQRPSLVNRNWVPPETVEDLASQNAENL